MEGLLEALPRLARDAAVGVIVPAWWGVAQGPYDVARRRASCAPLSWASTNSARRPQTNAHLTLLPFELIVKRTLSRSGRNLSDTFRSHAQECQRMASSMRDAADKATWSQMAKRWLAYAEYYEDRRSAFGTRWPRPATEGRIHVWAQISH